MSNETIDIPETEAQIINVPTGTQEGTYIPAMDGDYSKKQQELLDVENKIDLAMGVYFVTVGLELAMVQDKELYKIPRKEPVDGKYAYQTFEEYAQARYGYSSTYVYDLINGAKAVVEMKHLSARGGVSARGGEFMLADKWPTAERHMRPLLKLESTEDRLAVWANVITHKQTPTTTLIEKEVKLYNGYKNKEYQTVEEWKEDPWPISFDGKGTFNEQPGTAIEWARWSFNPITGCKHTCSFCYARSIENRLRPWKEFKPARWPARYAMPKNTPVPQEAAIDMSYKNVFVGSMADNFGRWIPKEWIQEIIDSAVENPQFNYLFLSKFPNRYKEFTYPKNVWLGTSVTEQKMVANAEKAFEHVEGTTWLSVEPMCTPLKFTHLKRFDWVVIGGASAQSSLGTPAWTPNMDWIMDLYQQARAAGCAIYFKDNLPITGDLRIKEFPWERPPLREVPKILIEPMNLSDEE